MNELQTFANGDIDYITKHNANYQNLKAAIDALEQLMGTQVQAVQGTGAALPALFGAVAARIGSGSYAANTSGTNLTLQAGYYWRPLINMVVSKSVASTLSFSGVASGTYYIQIDAAGNPMRTADITEAVYSVVWSGSAFSSVTAIAPIVWGSADVIAAQTSAALSATYPGLDARLEAGETKAVAGGLAQTWKMGKLAKTVAGGVDVTLTAVEANNFAIDFNGALTNNINVNFPLSGGPRGWVIHNNTTGNYTLTVKGSSGAGIKIAKGSKMWVMHDGTNLLAVHSSPGHPAIASLPYAASITADFSYADTVKVTLTGDASFTLSGAADKQKCILELTQGGSGSYTANFGAELRFGTDLTTLTLSTTMGKTDKIGFIYDAAAGAYDVVAFMKGF